MDNAILKTVGQVAGIAGLALGVLLLLFRDVIRKDIFPNLTKEQSYSLLRTIVILTWSVALIGILAWVYLESRQREISTANTAVPISSLIQPTSNSTSPTPYNPPQNSNSGNNKIATSTPNSEINENIALSNKASTSPTPITKADSPADVINTNSSARADKRLIPNYTVVAIDSFARDNDTAILKQTNDKRLLLRVMRGDVLDGRFRVTGINEREVVLTDTQTKDKHTLPFKGQ